MKNKKKSYQIPVKLKMKADKHQQTDSEISRSSLDF